MKRKLLKKLAVIVLSTAMAVTAAGCGAKDDQSSTSTGIPTEKQAADTKVALVLPGTVNDKGWNEEAYDGLMEIKTLGCQTAYSESVSSSDFETTFRGYAEQGYNFIIGHGTEFEDAIKKVAPDFPDTYFCVTSSDVSQSPNVCSLQNMNNQQGFITGVVAALATKTHKVAAIGGMEIPSIQSYIMGFQQGVEYVDNGTTALTAYTGDFEDATKVKEQAAAFIEQGADVVSHSADGAGLGLFEAVKDAGSQVYAIGAVKDQYEELPDQVLTSATNSIGDAMKVAVEQYMNGEITAQCYKYGIAEGVIGLADYHNCSDVLTSDQKQYVDDVLKKIASGEIEVKSAQK